MNISGTITLRGVDRRDASIKAAASLLNEMQSFLDEGEGTITVGWCGGTSPNEVFAPFAERFAELSPLERGRVHFVLVDERRVPLGDEQSNFSLLQKNLFDPLVKKSLISANQVHPFPVELAPDDAAKSYTDLVLNTLGGLHITVLGVGPDGHVAGIFPGHSSVKREGSEYVYVPDRPKPPAEGFSATRTLLAGCSVGFALFFGKEKQKPLADFFAGTDPVEVPARVVRQMTRGYVVTDLAL